MAKTHTDTKNERGFARRILDRFTRWGHRSRRLGPDQRRTRWMEIQERIRPKGHTVPRAEVARRRRRNKVARASRRRNRGR